MAQSILKSYISEMVQNASAVESLAERIAGLCVQKYAELGKQGKPRPGQWTVLSGVVLQIEDSLEVISLATGD